jgi:mannose/fructose/N-acetylgalactosamine-specific phosphotransferase system component IIB
MNIIHVRVDDRLVHGQVAFAWCRHLKVSHLYAVNDAAAADPVRRSIMEMMPIPDASVTVLTVSELCDRILEDQVDAADRDFVVVASPVDVVRVVDEGVMLSELTVGNIGHREGRVKITREVHVDPGELAALKTLADKGVTLSAQWLPGSPKVSLNSLLKETE